MDPEQPVPLQQAAPVAPLPMPPPAAMPVAPAPIAPPLPEFSSAPPASKRGLIIGIIVVVILIALGAGAYFFSGSLVALFVTPAPAVPAVATTTAATAGVPTPPAHLFFDPASLVRVGTSADPLFFTDGTAVYRAAQEANASGTPVTTFAVIAGASDASFSALSFHYSRDASHAFFDEAPIVGKDAKGAARPADPSSFTVLNDGNGQVSLARDAAALYWEGYQVTTLMASDTPAFYATSTAPGVLYITLGTKVYAFTYATHAFALASATATKMVKAASSTPLKVSPI